MAYLVGMHDAKRFWPAYAALAALCSLNVGCEKAAEALDANNQRSGEADARAQTLAEGRNFSALAIDGDTLFFADRGKAYARPLQGGEARELGTLDRDDDDIYAGDDRMVVDADSVYLASSEGLYVLPRAGGATRKIEKAEVSGVALSGDGIYFASRYEGAIYRADKQTLEVKPLVEGLGQIAGLVGDGDDIFFVDSERETVSRVPFAGGAPVNLATEQARPLQIAVTAGFVYWYNGPNSQHEAVEGLILRMPRAGGAPEVLLDSGASPPDKLLADEQYLYASHSAAGLERSPIAGGEGEGFAGGSIGDFVLGADVVYWAEDNSNNFSKDRRADPSHVRRATKR